MNTRCTHARSRRIALFALAGASLVTAFTGPAAVAGDSGIAYENDFSKPVGKEWDQPKQSETPSGDAYLGPFGAQDLKLTLDKLPEHEYMVIAFDLYVIGDWQGDNTLGGDAPSTISVTIDGVPTLLNASIASETGDDRDQNRRQSYPDALGKRWYSPGHGTFQVNNLGFVDPDSGQPRDATYRVILATRHSGHNVVIHFAAGGLKGDAQFGMDNMAIEVSSGQLDPADTVFLPTFDYGSMLAGAPRNESFPQGDAVGGGGSGGTDTPTPHETPAPGTVAVLMVGGGALMQRRRRGA